MRELKQAARDYKRRSERHAAETARLRDNRFRAIQRAHAAGLPASEIGAAYGISKQRVLEILNERAAE
jgi:hypothetical protein